MLVSLKISVLLKKKSRYIWKGEENPDYKKLAKHVFDSATAASTNFINQSTKNSASYKNDLKTAVKKSVALVIKLKAIGIPDDQILGIVYDILDFNEL